MISGETKLFVYTHRKSGSEVSRTKMGTKDDEYDYLFKGKLDAYIEKNAFEHGNTYLVSVILHKRQS